MILLERSGDLSRVMSKNSVKKSSMIVIETHSFLTQGVNCKKADTKVYNHLMKLKDKKETVRLHIICLLQYYENHPFPYGVDFYSVCTKFEYSYGENKREWGGGLRAVWEHAPSEKFENSGCCWCILGRF